MNSYFSFVVIDLFSQYDAIKKYTQGWGKKRILEWLYLFGEVIEVDYGESIGVSHIFRSMSKLETPFSFDESESLLIPNFVQYQRIDGPTPPH